MDNTENKSLDLTIKLELNDYKHFNFVHGKKRLIIELIFYFILFILVVAYISIRDAESSNEIFQTLAIATPIGLVVVFVMILCAYLLTTFKLKKIFESDKLIQRVQNYTFTNESINFKSENGSGSIKWDDVYKVVESKKAFAIYIAKIKALVIPKRFFNEENSIDSFKQLIKDNLPSKKIIFKK